MEFAVAMAKKIKTGLFELSIDSAKNINFENNTPMINMAAKNRYGPKFEKASARKEKPAP